MRVNTELAEHALHTEGTRFIGHNRHDKLANLLVTHQRRQDAHKGHRGRHFATFTGGLEQRIKRRQRRHLERRGFLPARRQITAQRGTTLAHVGQFRRAFLKFQIRHVFQLLVGHRNIKAVAESLDR